MTKLSFMEACWELWLSSGRPDRSPYVCFFYLGGGKVHTHTHTWLIAMLKSSERCRHKRHRREQKTIPQIHHWAGPLCVCGVSPSPPFSLALWWYSDYVCQACCVLKGWARQVAVERLSHWLFDYAQSVTPIMCVTVLHVNVYQGKTALSLDYWSV